MPFEVPTLARISFIPISIALKQDACRAASAHIYGYLRVVDDNNRAKCPVSGKKGRNQGIS